MARWGAGDTLRARVAREQIVWLALIAGYFVAAQVGFLFAYTHPAASVIWPASGIALGALLNLGSRVWPAIFGSALAAYAINLGPSPGILAIAAANTIEGLSAAYLINRFANGRHALHNPRNSLRFAGLVLLTHATISPVFNTLTLVFSDLAQWSDFGVLWMTFSIGSVVGALTIAPPIVLATQYSRVRWRSDFVLEMAAVMMAVLIVALLVFYDPPPLLRGFPAELLCLPTLLWAAFRLGRRPAAFALVLLGVVAVLGTIGGNGPFLRATPAQSLIVVQLFMGIMAAMTVALAALASEYSLAETQLRELVVTDPLTGMPNYRRLLEVLSAEIARADRHQGRFAVVFFDMDGLKRINDDLGHLAGSRAVCRFAETLRSVCRTTDTPARYGGDEFVAVLSDTDADGAAVVVQRVNQRLAEDTDDPPITVSAGIALYPRDGGTPTTLLSAADRALYASKADKLAPRGNVVAIHDWPTVVNR